MPQKLFRVKIYAYQYHADFIVKSADSALDIENAIIEVIHMVKKFLNQLNGQSHYLKLKLISSNRW